ncbi:cyclin-domain-containing protein, partial [Sistotremastrum suecicum HHB10207 ss-3]
MDDDVDSQILLPSSFEAVDVHHLVSLIADMLERLMIHNDRIPLSAETLTRFHSRTTPGISVLEYLQRIVRFANVERSCLLITLYYIDQICSRQRTFTLSSLTVHRFLITSIAVSSKAFCDAFYTNRHYARVGGIRVAELNVLEMEFLALIDWRLTCTPELLQTYYSNLAASHSSGKYKI